MTTVLVEDANLEPSRGRILNFQFMLEVGFPCLLAHGNSTSVTDAVHSSVAGEYNVWVWTKNWDRQLSSWTV